LAVMDENLNITRRELPHSQIMITSVAKQPCGSRPPYGRWLKLVSNFDCPSMDDNDMDANLDMLATRRSRRSTAGNRYLDL